MVGKEAHSKGGPVTDPTHKTVYWGACAPHSTLQILSKEGLGAKLPCLFTAKWVDFYAKNLLPCPGINRLTFATVVVP